MSMDSMVIRTGMSYDYNHTYLVNLLHGKQMQVLPEIGSNCLNYFF